MKIKMSPQKMSVQDAAQEYFSNINPIATRIFCDFEETKNSYECVWKTLSYEEQSQILNESIIKPEVMLKYSFKTSDQSENAHTSESFAHKRVLDENVSYRDEHSAPFSFKTLSQVDLRLFGSDPSKKVLVTPKLEPPKLQAPPHADRWTSAVQRVTRRQGRSGVQPLPEELQALVPGAPAYLVDDPSSPHVPKTGLDFLDNW